MDFFVVLRVLYTVVLDLGNIGGASRKFGVTIYHP